MFKFLGLIIGCVLIWTGCQRSNTLFESLPADYTGIHFSNNIEVSDTFNILESQYLYNGGGVGIGDFNNDGLEDIYFTGNHVDNKLYLNKGDLRFEDVTAVSGTAASGYWSSGVSVVDINNDGLLDIYVNNTTHPDSSDRVNVLFVNQGLQNGIPYFLEVARDYGLAVDNYTVNSVFFDYDNDGDLDVFMIINEQGSVRGTIAYQNRDKTNTTYQRIDKLFRNDWDANLNHPVFKEVTNEAGIEVAGFSLGVNVTDINKDGWKDIYISNDFISDNVIYINQGDGTFKNEARQYLKHTSHSAMGNDVVDINNDGFNDIIELDMLPEDNYRQKRLLGPTNYTSYINNEKYNVSYQFVRNTLQLNPGNEGENARMFSEISLHAGIAATDWSWTPLVADFDHDGQRDIIVTNGFPKDVTDRDYIDYRADAARFTSRALMLEKIPSVEIHNYAFKNNGNLTFRDVSREWGLTENTFSSGATYADLDNDGDLEIVINNIDRPASILKNNLIEQERSGHWISLAFEGEKGNVEALGATIDIMTDQDAIHYEHSIYRGYLSSHGRKAHIGLGNREVKSIIITWPDGKQCRLENMELDKHHLIKKTRCTPVQDWKQGFETPIFSEQEDRRLRHVESDFIDFNIQPLLPFKLSQYGPALAVGDINNDDLEDLYISGPAFTNGYFMIQQDNGGLIADTLYAIDSEKEQLGTLLLDVDGDQDLDMYVVCGSYEFESGDERLRDQLILNNNGSWLNASDKLPDFISNGICAKAADYDKDGDLDIFVGGRVEAGEYPSKVNSYLLKNELTKSEGRFELTEQELLEDIGMVTDALWTDYNNDGWLDLLIAREYEPILILENQKGVLVKKIVQPDLKGFWCSLSGGDFDNDGDVDYVLGNRGNNTFNKISKDYPYQILVSDFDNNDNTDAIPMAYFKNRSGEMDNFPTVSRMDFAKEINSIRKKYPSYDLYAQVNRDILFRDSTLKAADIFEVNYTPTSLMENLGNGEFAIKPLNIETQLSPIFGMSVEDFDGDGNLDIVMIGNDFGNELIFGRMDALNGVFLKGKGSGEFSTIPISESGWYVPGDGKSVVVLRIGDNYSLVAGENMGNIRFFSSSQGLKTIPANDDEYRAIIEIKDKRLIREIAYGNGFLSQSSRSVIIPIGTNSVTFISLDGKERTVEVND